MVYLSEGREKKKGLREAAKEAGAREGDEEGRKVGEEEFNAAKSGTAGQASRIPGWFEGQDRA
jgi:hypothetical protein